MRRARRRPDYRNFSSILAQRSCPARDRLCSLLERSPDRPMAVITAPTVKAAAEPQITPIEMPRTTSPVHHSTPRLTSTDTTKNTTVHNITVPAILVRILHPRSASLWRVTVPHRTHDAPRMSVAHPLYELAFGYLVELPTTASRRCSA